jgi:hypothetical protein
MTASTLTKKLQIKPGRTLVVLGAPPGFLKLLEPFPKAARRLPSLRGRVDVLLVFVRTLREALAIVGKAKRGLVDRGILWVCYPKLTSASAGELSRDVLWKALEPHGLGPVSMVAIDATWSAVRFRVMR